MSRPFTAVLLILIVLEGCSQTKLSVSPTESINHNVAQPPSTNAFDKVIFHECYDGDTCTVSLPGLPDVFGDHLAIRLVGIDAPEIKGHCEKEKELAAQARNLLNQRLKQAQVIQLRHTARDKYFRLLAEVVADGEELNELLLQRGLAVPYNGGTKTKDWCERP